MVFDIIRAAFPNDKIEFKPSGEGYYNILFNSKLSKLRTSSELMGNSDNEEKEHARIIIDILKTEIKHNSLQEIDLLDGLRRKS